MIDFVSGNEKQFIHAQYMDNAQKWWSDSWKGYFEFHNPKIKMSIGIE